MSKRRKKSVQKKKSPLAGGVETVAIVSDIHFDLHDRSVWGAFLKWFYDVKPSKLVIDGDFVDLGMLSNYSASPDDPAFAIEQIKCFIDEVNPLADIAEITVIEGNHDNRWDRIIGGTKSFELRGALGLTFKEQCYAQGLDKRIKWVQESTKTRGVQVGPFLLRHGHQQSGSFGGGKHLAATRLDKSLGDSEIFGHFHRAQLFCKTAGGKTAVAVANPCMTVDHEYNVDPNWQRGFTYLELYGPNNKYATPHLILIENGRFADRGKLYDGNC
jgi:predicted phosphodiesterase